MHFIHLEHFTGNDDEDKISTLSLVIILVVSCKFVFISFALIAVCYRLVELQYTNELKRTSKSLNFSLSMISLSLWLDCTRCVCSVNKFVTEKHNAIKGIVQGNGREERLTNIAKKKQISCCTQNTINNKCLHFYLELSRPPVECRSEPLSLYALLTKANSLCNLNAADEQAFTSLLRTVISDAIAIKEN